MEKPMQKKLYRSRHNKMITGVCGGMAEYFNMDPTVMRVIWIVGSLFVAGLLAYILCSIIIPEKPENYIDSL